MRRREFCGAGLAAGLVATYPFLAARADTGIAAVNLDGTGIELEKAAVNELADSLSGRLIMSGHPEYDTVRKVWNGMHDKRPALIARCADAGDVQQAVTFARERDLLVAVRGGGHSWPGKSVCDGGIMIDLAEMTAVNVDTSKKLADTQGGALLGHLDTASLNLKI